MQPPRVFPRLQRNIDPHPRIAVGTAFRAHSFRDVHFCYRVRPWFSASCCAASWASWATCWTRSCAS
jgi:hypothetical protein